MALVALSSVRRPRPALLWDWDGTIADTITQIVEAHHAATERVLDRRLDEASIRARIGEPARRRISALVDASHAHDVFRLYSSIMRSLDPADTQLFAEVLQVAIDASSAGIANVIVSSRPRTQILEVLRNYGVGHHFLGVVGLEDTGRHKPAPDPLVRGIEIAGSERRFCAYIGDAVVDMRAAAAAAIVGVGVAWGAGKPDDLAAAGSRTVVTSVEMLREFVMGHQLQLDCLPCHRVESGDVARGAQPQ